MGDISVGNIDAGRDVTIIGKYKVPNNWRRDAIEAMAGLNPQEREYVDGKTKQLQKELMNEQRPVVMSDILDAIRDIAPAVAQVVAAALPFLGGAHG